MGRPVRAPARLVPPLPDLRHNPALPTPHWPLFDVYPSLAEQLQPLPLCTLPSPVEALTAIGPQAWVKRDDVIHPQYGGNKMRKLEFVASELLRRGIRHVYSIGGTGTNFGVATALVLRELGIELTLFLFRQPPSAYVEHNQQLMRQYGARLHHFDSLGAAALAWGLHPRRLDPRCYFLAAGGSSPVATFGYINAAFELREQIERGTCPPPTQIIVPVGSSGTLAGLTLGCSLAGMATQVIGVRVSPEKLGFIDICTPAVSRRMMQFAADLLEQHGHRGRIRVPQPILIGDWFGPGYGCSTPATDAAIQKGTTAGLTLDSTYTGKAFGEFLKRLQDTRAPLLYWATLNSQASPFGA